MDCESFHLLDNSISILNEDSIECLDNAFLWSPKSDRASGDCQYEVFKELDNESINLVLENCVTIFYIILRVNITKLFTRKSP